MNINEWSKIDILQEHPALRKLMVNDEKETVEKFTVNDLNAMDYLFP